jgi:hypothetical protein
VYIHTVLHVLLMQRCSINVVVSSNTDCMPEKGSCASQSCKGCFNIYDRHALNTICYTITITALQLYLLVDTAMIPVHIVIVNRV